MSVPNDIVKAAADGRAFLRINRFKQDVATTVSAASLKDTNARVYAASATFAACSKTGPGACHKILLTPPISCSRRPPGFRLVRCPNRCHGSFASTSIGAQHSIVLGRIGDDIIIDALQPLNECVQFCGRETISETQFMLFLDVAGLLQNFDTIYCQKQFLTTTIRR